MPGISVIIPVYNAAKTLDACLQSLLQQSYEDFEMLLIDDGSTDGSGALCNAWRVRDARVRTMHQQNAGVQAAVLRGIAQARAVRCTFVDSDDTVKPDFLSALFQGMQKTGADIVCCGFCDKNEAGEERVAWQRETQQCYDAIQISGALDRFFYENADLTDFCAAQRWNKLYRTEILRTIAPALDPAQAFGEDTVMNLYALSRCKRLAVVPYVGYCYTVQSASATRSMNAVKYGQYCHMMQCLRKAAEMLHREERSLQARQDSLFSALALQTLLSPLRFWEKRCIICALRANIADKEALVRLAATQPIHGWLALQSIKLGAVIPATAAAQLVLSATKSKAQ